MSDPAKPLGLVHYLPRVRLEEGGVVRFVLDLCAVMASRGHRVFLLTTDSADVPAGWNIIPSGTEAPAAQASAGVPNVAVVPRGIAGRLRGDALTAARVLLVVADVLHLHTPWDLANLQLARLARRCRVPYVVTVHGMLDDWSMAQKGPKKRLFLALFARRLLERAAVVHCTAQAELEQASRRWRSARGAVLPCLVDLAPYHSLPGPGAATASFPILRDSGLKVLFLSRLHPKKGAHVLVEAGAILRDRGIEFRLLLAGPGDADYERSLREMVRQKGLGERVAFLGAVRGVQKLSLYQAADLFVLPSSQENFGLVFIESLACGTPVVMTRGVDIWSELETAGAIVTDNTPAAVADAIEAAARQTLADPASLRRLGERGRRWVFENLEPDELARKYEALYAGTSSTLSR